MPSKNFGLLIAHNANHIIASLAPPLKIEAIDVAISELTAMRETISAEAAVTAKPVAGVTSTGNSVGLPVVTG
jgi:hypothetical protein